MTLRPRLTLACKYVQAVRTHHVAEGLYEAKPCRETRLLVVETLEMRRMVLLALKDAPAVEVWGALAVVNEVRALREMRPPEPETVAPSGVHRAPVEAARWN